MCDALRQPRRLAVLHQCWSRLLFLHWPVPVSALRAQVPRTLDLDLWAGQAWVGVVVFEVSRMRPAFLPPLPVLSRGLEVNVRTYVLRDGEPGLWFFSLDITNALAVWAARAAYRLPYFRARMRMHAEGARTSLVARRTDPRGPAASFTAQWETGAPRASPQPGTHDHFLLHRCTLFAGRDARWRAQVRHPPWPLAEVHVTGLASTLLEAQGLPVPQDAPLLHAQRHQFEVAIEPPSRR